MKSHGSNGEGATQKSANSVLQGILERIANTALHVLGADTIDLYEYRADRDEFLLPPVTVGKRWFAELVPTDIPADDVVAQVARSQMRIFASPAQEHPVLAAGRFVKREGIASTAAVPITVGEEALGAMFASYRSPCNFDEDVELRERIDAFASFAGTAIQNARLLQRERQLRQEAETLGEISEAMSSAMSLKEVAGQILDGLDRVINYRKATFQSLRGDARNLVDYRGFGPERVDEWLLRPVPEDQLISRVVQSRHPLILPHPADDPDWEVREETADVKSWVGLPLVYGDETIGLLTLDHDQPGYYTETVKDTLVTFSNYAAVAVKKAQLLADAENRIRDLEIISDVGRLISTQLNTEGLLQTIVSEVADKLSCTHCTLFLAEKVNGEEVLMPQVTSGKRPQVLQRRFKPGEGLAGWVFQHGQPLVTADARLDSRFAPPRDEQPLPRSMLVAPVQVADRTIGVISADQDELGWFSENDLSLVEGLALQAGIAIERNVGLELLSEIGNRIISAQKIEGILQEIVKGAIRLTNTTAGVIYLLSSDKKSIFRSFEWPPDFQHPPPRLDQETSITREIIRAGRVIDFSNIEEDSRVNPDLHSRVRAMIAAPLKTEDDVVGVLYLNDARPRVFTDIQRALLATLANQAATALENARRFHELQERANQLESLQRVTTTLVTDPSDSDKVLALILQGVSQAFPNASCAIRLYDRQTNQFTALTAAGKLEPLVDILPSPKGTSHFVINTGKARYLTGDELLHPSDGGPPVREDIRDQGIKATAYLPLMVENDVIGVLYVDLETPHEFSTDDRRFLELFANSAAIAIRNARLYRDRDKRVQELQALTKIGQTVSNLGIDDIVDLIYEQMGEIMDLSNAQVQIAFYENADKDEVTFPLAVEQDEGQVIDRVRWGKREPQFRTGGEDEDEQGGVEQLQPRKSRVPPGLTEHVIHTEKPLLIEEDFERRAHDLGVKVWPKFGIKQRPTHSWLGVPMVVKDNVVGIISVQSLEIEHAFDQSQVELLTAIANSAAVAIENARLYETLDRQVRERTQQWIEARQKAAAAEQLSLMNQVAAEFAHKMNNLAGTMPVRVDYLRNKFQQYSIEDQGISEMLEGIRSDAVTLLEGARTIRESTQSESLTDTDLNESLRIAVQRVRRTHPAMREVRVIDEGLDPGLPTLILPRNRLMDTLENLIRNAVEAMSGSGTLTLSTSVTTKMEREYWKVEIKDTGSGIPRKSLPKIFDLFFSTKPSGMGLGLWRDKNLVKELGGDIAVETELDVGTTFTLLLPSQEV